MRHVAEQRQRPRSHAYSDARPGSAHLPHLKVGTGAVIDDGTVTKRLFEEHGCDISMLLVLSAKDCATLTPSLI